MGSQPCCKLPLELIVLKRYPVFRNSSEKERERTNLAMYWHVDTQVGRLDSFCNHCDITNLFFFPPSRFTLPRSPKRTENDSSRESRNTILVSVRFWLDQSKNSKVDIAVSHVYIKALFPPFPRPSACSYERESVYDSTRGSGLERCWGLLLWFGLLTPSLTPIVSRLAIRPIEPQEMNSCLPLSINQ